MTQMAQMPEDTGGAANAAAAQRICCPQMTQMAQMQKKRFGRLAPRQGDNVVCSARRQCSVFIGVIGAIGG